MGKCRKSTAPLFHPSLSATYASLLATRAKPYCAGFSGLVSSVLKERRSKRGGWSVGRASLDAGETGGCSDDFSYRNFEKLWR